MVCGRMVVVCGHRVVVVGVGGARVVVVSVWRVCVGCVVSVVGGVWLYGCGCGWVWCYVSVWWVCVMWVVGGVLVWLWYGCGDECAFDGMVVD